ncbi:hypothetical protein R8535_04615 [Francisella sp. 19S2-4]|nr:hypothetical protein [Francisella sp. 19S2-4]
MSIAIRPYKKPNLIVADKSLSLSKRLISDEKNIIKYVSISEL